MDSSRQFFYLGFETYPPATDSIKRLSSPWSGKEDALTKVARKKGKG